jgi:microcystin-dependent protein
MLKNLVEETANNPGTGATVTLGGAPAGRLTWRGSGFANGAQVFYFITDGTIGEWGIGTLTLSASDTITRSTVIGNTAGTFVKLNFTGTCRVYNALPAERALYVGQASLTLDGDVAITKATPQLSLNKAASGQSASIVGTLGGTLRWRMELGNGQAETGVANNGSHFFISRFTDAGALIDNPFFINRSTGAITLTSATVTFTGAVSAVSVAASGAVTGATVAASGAMSAGSLTVGGSPLWEAGDIKTTARTTPSAGWLFCDGASLAVASYPALFDALGYTFGGSGANFNVPDYRGRTVFGRDNMGGSAASRLTTAGGGVDGATLGATGGAQNHTLTAGQVPAHSHAATTDSHGGHTHTGTTNGWEGAHQHTYANPSNFGGGTVFLQGGSTYGQANIVTSGAEGAHQHNFTTTSNGAHSHAATTDSFGGGGAHPQIPPALVCNFVIKT